MQPLRELLLLRLSRRAGMLRRLLEPGGLGHERAAHLPQPVETDIARHRKQPFSPCADDAAVLPKAHERLLRHVFRLVLVREQRARDAIDDPVVSQHGQPELHGREAGAALGIRLREGLIARVGLRHPSAPLRLHVQKTHRPP